MEVLDHLESPFYMQAGECQLVPTLSPCPHSNHTQSMLPLDVTGTIQMVFSCIKVTPAATTEVGRQQPLVPIIKGRRTY